MSESHPQEVLNKKRGRSKQSKDITQPNKPQLIKKRVKIGKKQKIKSRQINIIKPKPIKKSISYNNYPTTNINPINTFAKNYPNDDNNFKKDDSCQENSLGQLTKNFINYIKTTGKKSININDLVNELEVKKRRIYDITNVLQGIGYLQKSGKNEIIWTKTNNNKIKSKKKSVPQKKVNINNNKQKINLEKLEGEKNTLDEKINNFKDEFNSLAKKAEFAKYGYITLDDLKSLSINDKVDLLVIKATKGTVMNIVDKNDIKITYDKVKKLMEMGEMELNEVLLNKLKKNNQIFFNCPEEVGLNLYSIKSGELYEIGNNKNKNNSNNNGKNIEVSKFVNNNFNIKNLIENKNYNIGFNYNVNLNKDNYIQNNNNSINTNNNYNNNIYNNNNNKEELSPSKYQNNNTSFPKNFHFNYNEGGNNETIPHNITVNNEEKNIGVYATPSKAIYSQNHIYNSQIGGGGYINYKNQINKPNTNPNNNNKNCIQEQFSFSANSSFPNKITK
jgi:transcription factor E2F3